MKKFINGLLWLSLITFSLSVASCKDDSDDPTDPNEPDLPASTIVNGIDLSLLPGHYEFSGNIAPHFTLYSDGSCETYSSGTSTSDDTGKWTYDREGKILVLLMDRGVNHTYTVKSLSESSITAEWSSVKYGNYTATWTRTTLPEIDSSLLPGTYVYNIGTTYKYILSLKQDGTAAWTHQSNYYGSYGHFTNDWTSNSTWEYDEMRRLIITGIETKPGESPRWRIKSLTSTTLELVARHGNEYSAIYTRIN